MDDDFNTAGQSAHLNVLVTSLNRLASAPLEEPSHRSPGGRDTVNYASFKCSAVVLRMLSNILGLFWEPPAKKSLGDVAASSGVAHGSSTVSGVPKAILKKESLKNWNIMDGLTQLSFDLQNNLVTESRVAAKDNPLLKVTFDQIDLVRTRLAQLGITLEDRPRGTRSTETSDPAVTVEGKDLDFWNRHRAIIEGEMQLLLDLRNNLRAERERDREGQPAQEAAVRPDRPDPQAARGARRHARRPPRRHDLARRIAVEPPASAGWVSSL